MRVVWYRLRATCSTNEHAFELLIRTDDGQQYQHVTGPESDPAAKRLTTRLLRALAASWPLPGFEVGVSENHITSV